MNRLNEAGSGNIDRLYTQVDKAIQAIQKVQDAALKACDSLDSITLEAADIGGSLGQKIPQTIAGMMSILTNQIANQLLKNIIEGDGQNSLKGVKELIENTPYREYGPQPTGAQKVAQIGGMPNVNAPDLSQGPQSAIAEDLEGYYRNGLKEDTRHYNRTGLDFEALRETETFGQTLDGDMMSKIMMKAAAPIQPKHARTVIREAARANDAMFEETEEEDRSEEKLAEGSFFNGMIKAFGGKDGMPLSFNTLREGAESLNFGGH